MADSDSQQTDQPASIEYRTATPADAPGIASVLFNARPDDARHQQLDFDEIVAGIEDALGDPNAPYFDVAVENNRVVAVSTWSEADLETALLHSIDADPTAREEVRTQLLNRSAQMAEKAGYRQMMHCASPESQAFFGEQAFEAQDEDSDLMIRSFGDSPASNVQPDGPPREVDWEQFHIRQAGIDDAPRLAGYQHQPVSKATTSLSNPTAMYVIATDDKEVFGAARVMLNPGGRAYLVDLGVDDDLQRHGIGTEVMKETMRKLADADFDHLDLIAGNPDAEDLYVRLGFQDDAAHEGYMTRSLADLREQRLHEAVDSLASRGEDESGYPSRIAPDSAPDSTYIHEPDEETSATPTQSRPQGSLQEDETGYSTRTGEVSDDTQGPPTPDLGLPDSVSAEGVQTRRQGRGL